VTFANPNLLFGLLAVPLAAIGYLVLESRRARRSRRWSRGALLPNIIRRRWRRFGYVPALLFLLGLVFLLVGFARPQRVLAGATPGAATVVLTFDTSGSMAADDAQPTRIRAARKLAIEFLNELPSKYRVAVVTFANKVHLAVPPTFDRKAVLAGLPKKVTPRAGTAIGDGINEAVAVVVAAAEQSGRGQLTRPGSVLVFSDGAQTAGGTSLRQAAVAALVDYIPVDTIAVGTHKGIVTQPFELNGVETSTQIPVPVDPAGLRFVSQQTGGTFFQASTVAGSPGSLAKVYANLHSYAASGQRKHALTDLSAGLALLSIVAAIGLSGLWFGRVA
jgi:Ca-activated chloride channel homolog